MEHDFIPPDPWAADLAKLKAAAATQVSTFEEQWKADRLRELAIEHAEIDAHIAATPRPRLTAAQIAEYAPPDPYAADIKALLSKEAR